MTDYQIAKIYAKMEDEIIASMKRNLTRHLAEEQKVGVQYAQWQAIKLKELKRYQRQNEAIINRRTKGLPKEVRNLLMSEFKQGAGISKTGFFQINDKKVKSLIDTVNGDLKKAEHAVLRKANDEYRRVIHEAAMYKSHGVFTEKQAIAKAIKAFEGRGLRSVEYKNGAKHLISDYAEMAVRTASQRAQLMGEGEFRKSIGESRIKISKHGTACELCKPWEGKVLIDDVYSGGKKSDGSYPLLSEAMGKGLFHPRCRHGTSTYYPELEDEQKALSQSQKSDTITSEEELKTFLDDFGTRHGVSIDAAVYGLDYGAVKESLAGVEEVLKEFPKARSFLKSLGIYDKGIMGAGYSGKIYFNPLEYEKGKATAAAHMAEGSASGFLVKNASIRSAGYHEAGHLLEKALIYLDPQWKQEAVRLSLWRHGVKSSGVIDEAVSTIQKTNPGMSKDFLVSQVSKYAGTSANENLAECVADYLVNGGKAALLSREVWKILKRELG